MKISKAVILCSSIILLFASCGSSKQQSTVESDSYGIESTEEGDEYSDETTNSKSSSEKKKGFSLASLFASKFIEYDQTTLFTLGTFGGIKQKNAVTVFYPKTGNAGFGSPIMAAYYYLTFDDAGRAKIEKAVNQYLSDFENKKLDRKSKNSFKAYGSVKSYLYWGTVKTSSPNNAIDNIYLGYTFVGNSPYFTLFMYPTTNMMYTGPDSNYTEKSISLHYYFTKAQAQSLVDKLSSENVAAAIAKYENESYGMAAEADDYESDVYDSEDVDDGIILDGPDVEDGIVIDYVGEDVE